MPGMSGMGGTEWLPAWVRVLGAAVFVLAGWQHLRHAATMSGARRLWHLGHAAMAVGMVVMYWPAALRLVGAAVVREAFLAATVTLVAVAGATAVRSGQLNPLWMASAVEMAAMTYMFAVVGRPDPLVADAFVLYFLVQAVAWSLGWWGRYRVFEWPALAFAGPGWAPGGPTAAHTAAAVTAGAVAAPAAPTAGRPMRAASPAVTLSSTCSPALRVSLAAMAVGMGYTLLVM